MNTTQQHIVAIEIGSSKIKGAVGIIDSDNHLSVKAIEEGHQNPNYVRYGYVQNVKEVANELDKVIAKLNASIAPARITSAYISVGGRSMKTTPTTLTHSLPGRMEVTHDMVQQLLNQAKPFSPDREILDVEPVEFLLDGKSQGGNPEGFLCKEIGCKANLVTCRSQLLNNLSLAITDKLGIRINGYVVRPTALADLVVSADERRLGAVLVDFGAETTTVAIYKGGSLRYLATIPLGSRHITRDIMNLPCTEEQAEQLKRTVGNANSFTVQRSNIIGEIDNTELNNYVSARVGEIVSNVFAQLNYAGFSDADLPGGIVLVGGGAQLMGFADALSSTTGMNVRRGAMPPTVHLAGAKIRTTEDLDIISTLFHLAGHEGLATCITTPDNTELPPVEEDSQDDEIPENIEEEIEEIRPRRGFGRRMMDALRGTLAPAKDTDDDDSEDDY